MSLRPLYGSAVLYCLLAWPTGALAQADEEEATTEGVAQPAEEEATSESIETITVKGRKIGSPIELRPETSIDRDDLLQRPSGTLGAAVSDEPGVHSASFGPGVGLPVIRGMSGSRVKATIGGIGTHDASTVSPDHAVTAEPVLADEVRILRGPSTIRFGSGAIGGVVDVDDGRIPSRSPPRLVTGAAEGRYETNGAGRVVAGRIDAGHDPVAFHADGFYRARSDIDTPGYAIDEAAVLHQFGLTPDDNTGGYVSNTDARASGGSVGVSVFRETSMIGASAATLQNDYGIPGGAHAHVHAGVPQGPDFARIDLDQQRYDLRALLEPGRPWLESVDLRVGYIDYLHDEVDAGVPVTTFSNRALEARLELGHDFGEHLSGTIGLQGVNRDFSALGEEAFVPESDIETFGIYLIERLEVGRLRLEGAVRHDRQDVSTQPQPTIFETVAVFPDSSFRPLSWSASAGWQFDRRNGISLTYSPAQRAPDVQELYSLGPHLATRTFDIGDPALEKEHISGIDLGIESGFWNFDGKLNLFSSRAREFIYQQSTGGFYDVESELFTFACVRLEDCLPVVQYTQKDATLRGYEAQLTLLLEPPVGSLELTAFSDFVRARFRDDTDVPRMPPRRTGMEAAASVGDWTARVRYTHGSAQDRPGEFETPTAAYDLLNTYLEYRTPERGGRQLVVFLNATNLLDEEVRNSTSFLRSFAPEPGRSVEIGVRGHF